MRPRPMVDLQSPMPPDEVLARLRQAVSEPDAPVEGHVGARELSLVARKPARHLFSPWISLEVRASGEGSRLRGRFCPQPALWTGFVFIYALQVFVAGGGAMFGAVQLAIGDDATLSLGAAAVATVTLGLSCAVDLTGRAVGRPQMEIIRAFLETRLA